MPDRFIARKGYRPRRRIFLGSISPSSSIQLSASTIPEDASVGDPVGTFSVSGGSGTYTFTLTDDAGGLFAIDGNDLEVAGALDYETAASHSITVEADNGVDDPISRTFSITVTNVSEGGGDAPSMQFNVASNSQLLAVLEDF